MEKSRRDRRFWLVSVGLCLLSVAVVAGLKKMSQTVPYSQCSEVYKRYSEVEGIRATYVKDYRVNDTLTVGVTLLEAETDSGWARLQEDFDLPAIPKEYEKYFYGDSNNVAMKDFPKEKPLYLGDDTIVNDWIAISFYRRTICHFVIKSEDQRRLIMHKHYDDNLKH